MDLTRAIWRKSSFSGDNGGQCVEIAAVSGKHAACGHVIAVRDSKDPAGPVLAVAPGGWRAFTAGVKAGVFDLA
jgi:Domain of unknown function (DUF397)